MSVPWMWETSKASMRFGGLGKIERLAEALQHFARVRFENAKAPLKRVAGVTRHQFQKRALGPGLRGENVDGAPALLREHFLQRFAIVEVHGRVNLARQILLVQIDLLEQRGEELARVEFFQVLPEKLAPVQHAPAAQVKKVDGHHAGLPGGNPGCPPPRRSSPPFSAARAVLPRSESGRDSGPHLRTRASWKRPPCARAGCAPDRFRGLPAAAGRRARPRRSVPAWSGSPRTVPGSA